MKALVKVSDDITFEVNGEDAKTMFQELANVSEQFGNNVCKKCGSKARYVVRNVADNDFLEMRCTNDKCRAKLSFGLHKKGGGIFPKRKNEDGSYHPYGGWKIFDKVQNKEV